MATRCSAPSEPPGPSSLSERSAANVAAIAETTILAAYCSNIYLRLNNSYPLLPRLVEDSNRMESTPISFKFEAVS